VLVCGMLGAMPAYAYIDPNPTSLLTQDLTPVLIIAAAGMTFLRKQAGSAIGWLARRIHQSSTASDLNRSRHSAQRSWSKTPSGDRQSAAA
jgi:hypothetical protein